MSASLVVFLFAVAALAPGEVASPSQAVAVLCEPDMPVTGAASRPEQVARILTRAGFRVELLSAAQFADPQRLCAARVDIAVIPTGESFPACARANFIQYLRDGGDFINLGGYAFNRPLVMDGGRWVTEESKWQAARKAALRPEKSLLPNGGFEALAEVPIGGVVADGQWRRDGAAATVGAHGAPQGQRCARVSLPADQPSGSSTFYLDLTPESGQTYEVTCQLKSEHVAGAGMAYAAVYQHAADGRIVEFRDFVIRRGTTDWSEGHYAFSPSDRVSRVRVQCGLYNATGTAWFDDIRLAKVTGLAPTPMNTATGVPADGLVTRPEQIGVFDASFPLRRARGLRSSANPWAVGPGVDMAGDLTGWAAVGVVGDDDARWMPVLETYDRYNRPRGAAASIMFHYNGYYRGSAWGFCGIDNIDLFAEEDGPGARVLRHMARCLARETYLRNLRTDQRLYRDGETVLASVVVANRGATAQPARVEFTVEDASAVPAPSARVMSAEDVLVAPGAERTVTAAYAPGTFRGDLCRVAARLSVRGDPIDALETGFVVERPDVRRAAAPSRFENNYFTHGGRPVFLFGADTYSYTYRSAFDNPQTWAEDHRAARDVGLQVYENLQYSQPGHRLADADWRAFRAMAQLTQKHALVFMPGMLIGENVVANDEQLREQSDLCAAYAEKLGDTPALHYYINGDYRLDFHAAPDDARRLWNQWLSTRYGQAAAVSRAWGGGDLGEWGGMPFPPPTSGRWDDVAAIDRTRFEVWLTNRWNAAHVRAVRRHDAAHPIMSEYYQRPSGGLDLPLTIDGQDVADIGYFDEPATDIERLPLAIRFNDLRARGKGVALGEYGVKTHPAWTVENGAAHYHIRRGEEEQKRLFLAVGHYGLGLGAAKIQTWCLADSRNRVFPWGLFHPHQLIPKDVAYAHRNQSVIWRFFSPRYEPPALTLCLPNQLRLGNRSQLGLDVAYRAIEDLLSAHFSFNVLDDDHLDAIPAATRALLYPAPFAVEEPTYQRLLAWARAGGDLIVTGDLSYDENRRPTRRARLEELLGVAFVAANYPHVERAMGAESRVSFDLPGLAPLALRPCVRTRAVAAEVLGGTEAGLPVLTRHRLGSGCVYWLADPLELDGERDASEKRRALYAALLRCAGVRALPVQPRAAWLHAMVQPAARSDIHVLFNRQAAAGYERIGIGTAAGDVQLDVRNGWPALVAVTRDQRVVAVHADGKASICGESLLDGKGLKAALSLDGQDLRRSAAILVAPFECGAWAIPARARGWTAQFGEFRDGRWMTLEQVDLAPRDRELAFDADRATCLLLLCEPARAGHWREQLSGAMLRPERIAGY